MKKKKSEKVCSQKSNENFCIESVCVTGAIFQEKSWKIQGFLKNGHFFCPFSESAFENRKKSWMLGAGFL